MTYYATEDDYSLLRQNEIKMYSRIELLNNDMQIEGTLDGDTISGDGSINSESDVRRTYNVSMIVKNKSFNIGENCKIWYTKFIRIWEGYYSLRKRKIIWYLVGTFLFNDIDYKFDVSTSVLSVVCLDLTSLADGTRNGYTKGNIVKVEEGKRTRDVLISLITQECGLSKYRIEENPVIVPDYLSDTIAPQNQIPYDLEFGLTDAVWSKISKIKDFYPGWEAFFDTDGTFVYQPIPTCIDDELVLTSDIMDLVVIDEPTSASFSEIANVTDLYGQSIEADRFSMNCVVAGSNYAMTMTDDLSFDGSAITTNTKIEVIVTQSNVKGQTMSFNEGTKYKICYEDGSEIDAAKMFPNVNYVVKYRNNILIFLGEYQVHAICKELTFTPTNEQIVQDKIIENCNNIKYVVNPDSPYAIKKMWVGEIRNPLSGGEYENIYSSELALQCAEYENWKKTRLVQTITFTMRDVPWLDVNQKIEYKSKRTGELKQYIVKSINRTLLSGISTVQCIEFYPLYPFVVKK